MMKQIEDTNNHNNDKLFSLEENSLELNSVESSDLDIIQSLSSLIKDYLESHKLSKNAFSKLCYVSEKTIRRLVNTQYKSLPDVDTVIKVLKVVFDESSLDLIFKSCQKEHKNLSLFLKKALPLFLDSKKNESNDEDIKKKQTHVDFSIEQEITQREKFIIYQLIHTRKTIYREDIFILMGQLGVNALDDLIENNVLEEDKTGVIKSKKSFQSLLPKALKHHIADLAAYFEPKRISKNENLIYTLIESVNEKGLNEILKVQFEAVTKINEIMQQKEYEGEIPVYSVHMVDLFELTPNLKH